MYEPALAKQAVQAELLKVIGANPTPEPPGAACGCAAIETGHV